jgi:hypothetical protein
VLDELERRTPPDVSTIQMRGRLLHADAVQKRARDDLELAEKAVRGAIVQAELLLQKQAMNPQHRSDLAFYQVELAASLLLQKRLVDVEKVLGVAWQNLTQAARSKVEARGTAKDTDTWVNVIAYRRVYADLMADLGRYDQVKVVAQDIRDLGISFDDQRFQVAALYGRAAILASLDANLDEPTRAKRMAELAELSLQELGQLENGSAFWADLQTDPDLESIRLHRDFATATKHIREPVAPPRESPSKP